MINEPRSAASLDYVRAFVQAAERVLGEVLGEVPTKGTPIFQKEPSIGLQEVNVTVGITGDLQGQVNFGMDMTTALAIASTMMMETVAALDEMSISALQELSNMISGNARFFLNDLGVKSDITPPTMLVGKDMSATWHRIRAMAVPLEISSGKILVTVGIRQGE
ncbi:MAG TPA: chemotaxis protein CheX [Stenomitos sp.]